MSTCISRAGEYSSHTPSDQPFICGLCFAFDEDAALTALRTAEAEVEAQEAENERLIAENERVMANYKTAEADRDRAVREALENAAQKIEAVEARIREADQMTPMASLHSLRYGAEAYALREAARIVRSLIPEGDTE